MWAFPSGGSTTDYQLLFDSSAGFSAGSLPANSRAVAGDFDGDGKGDTAVTFDYGNHFKVWAFPSGGSTTDYQLLFDSSAGFSTGSLPANSRAVAGDFDGDGKDDTAVTFDYAHSGENDQSFRLMAITHSGR